MNISAVNRRGFLKLAATAPVATPAAVKSALASQPWEIGGYVGVDGAELIDPNVAHFFERLHTGDFIRLKRPTTTFRICYDPRSADHVVEQQMIEHDLFDFSTPSPTATECRSVG